MVKVKMKTAYNSWIYCSFPGWTPCWTLEDAIKRIAAAGFDAIEMGACSPHAWPPYIKGERLESVKKALKENNLEVSAFNPALGGGPGINPASPLEEERNAARDHFLGLVDLADELKCNKVIYHGYKVEGQRLKDARSNLISVLRDVLERAEEKKVYITLEPTPIVTNIIITPDDALQIIDEVDSSYLNAMFDVMDALFLGDSPLQYCYDLEENGHLGYVHLCDNDPRYPGEFRLPPGEGELDLDPLMKELIQGPYDDYLAVELIGVLDPDGAAYKSQENLQKWIEKYG